MTKNESKLLLFFLVGWTILNLVQSGFLDINMDEAYYKFYSQDLQWGYFDHPPVVAALIRFGYWLIPNEVGVRLPFILLSSASIWLLWKISGLQNLKLFLKVVVSIIAIHIMSFHALPDIPLIFFCLVYLYFLKKYIESDKMLLVIPISLSVVLMFLSKYYGALIPIATIAGAPFLLKRKTFWMIVVLSLILLIPHILWQIRTDFVSLKFHLVDRSFGQPYNFDRTFLYLLIQPLMAGPIIGAFLIWMSIKYRTKNSLEKVLKFIMYLFYVVFLLATFKGKVLTSWTAPAIIPLVILALRKVEGNPAFFSAWRKFLNISFVTSISLIFLLRVFLVYDFIPHEKMKYDYVHGFRNWEENIKAKAQGCPVVFVDNFEQTSRYMFYAKQYAHALGSLSYRRTYFDYSNLHRELFGKRVLLLGYGDSLLKPGVNQEYHYGFADNFATYPGIQISSQKQSYSSTKQDEAIEILVKISRNPYTNSEMAICKSFLSYGIFNKEGKLLATNVTEIELGQLNGTKDWTPVSVRIPPEKNKYYYLRFGLRSGTLPATLNSNTIRMIAAL